MCVSEQLVSCGANKWFPHTPAIITQAQRGSHSGAQPLCAAHCELSVPHGIDQSQASQRS